MSYLASSPAPGRRPGLALIALVLASFVSHPSESEAGLFKKLKEKRQARAAEAARAAEVPKEKPKPIPQHRSNYTDSHQDAYINERLLAGASPTAPRKIVVDIGRQRAFLVIHGLVAIDTAVSSARSGKRTPRGTFKITEKVKSGKVSTIYHVYMPYWMRIGQTTEGLHVGDLPGYPASAGCIRLPQSVAPILFEHTSVGVPVEVVDSWDEKELMIPYTFRKPPVYTDT
jgi:lipoprotein-anchoring transpeptidase ErfK/SrfK